MKYNLVSPNDIFYEKDFVLYISKHYCWCHWQILLNVIFCNKRDIVHHWTSISAAIYFLLCSYSSYVCVVFFFYLLRSFVCEKETKSIYMYTWIDQRYLSLLYAPLKNMETSSLPLKSCKICDYSRHLLPLDRKRHNFNQWLLSTDPGNIPEPFSSM